MAKYGTFKYDQAKYGVQTPVPPKPVKPKYNIGDKLAESISAPDTIPWYKNQSTQTYVVKKYDPIKLEYMIVGWIDNYPRFFTEKDLDIRFTIVNGSSQQLPVNGSYPKRFKPRPPIRNMR